MANKFIIAAQSLGRLALGFFALCLTLVIVLQIGFLAGALWLGTAGGQHWIESRINTLTAPGGTIVRFSRLTYDPGYGLLVRDLVIAGSDGSMIEANQARLDIALLPLMARHLSVRAMADTIILHPALDADNTNRQAPQENTAQSLTGFDMPDLFFTSASIPYLGVRELHLRGENPDQTLILSPALEASVTLKENTIGARARLTIDQPYETRETIPSLMAFDGTLATDTLSLQLDHLSVHAGAYDIAATLSAGLPLAGKGEATIRLPRLEENGLSPLLLTFDADNQRGNFLLESAYKDAPLSLASTITLDDTAITLSDIHLKAPELSGGGDIAIDRTTFLADGTLSLNADRLAHYTALFDMPLSGRATADIAFHAADQAQSLTLDASALDLRYEEISARKIMVTAHIPDISHGIPENLTLDAQGLRLNPQTSFETLQAALAPQDDFYRFTMTGKGRSHVPFSLSARANLYDILTQAPSARDITATLSARRSALTLTGAIDTQTIDMTARTDGLPLGILPIDVPEAISRLSLSGDLRLHGPMAAPIGEANIALSPLRLRNKAADLRLSFDGDYRDQAVSISLRGTGTGINTLTGSAAFPMTLSLHPFTINISDATPLSGMLESDINTATLAALFLPPDHLVDGALQAQLTIGGTLAAPAINGPLSLTQGTYIYEPYGVTLNDLTVRANLSDTHIMIDTLSAHDGEQGRINGNGRYGLSDGNASLDLAIDHFHLFRSDTVDGIIDGALSLTAANHNMNIGGTLSINPMTINIPEQFQTDIPELNIVEAGDDATAASMLETISLNVAITADRLFVRGWGLDAEFDGAIDMSGTLADPQFNGSMSAERGRYEEFGRRFDLAKANMRFQGSIPPSPYLDIEATTRAGDVTAAVLLSGPVNNPAINFSSTPALPEDEVLAYILFGRSMNRITPFQAVQLTQTLRRFSGEGGGGFDPLGTIRSLTGLDDIRVDTDEEGAASVGAGKYLTDDVYLEVESGAGEAGGAATLQIEVTPNITVESEVGQDAQAGGGIFWRYDY